MASSARAWGGGEDGVDRGVDRGWRGSGLQHPPSEREDGMGAAPVGLLFGVLHVQTLSTVPGTTTEPRGHSTEHKPLQRHLRVGGTSGDTCRLRNTFGWTQV